MIATTVLGTRWAFEVYDEDRARWFPVGGAENSMAIAEIHHQDFIFSHDKRTRLPKMRIVKIVTTEEEVAIWPSQALLRRKK